MVARIIFVIILSILLPYSFCLPSCEKICPQNQVFSSKVSQCQSTCWKKEFNVTSKCKISPGCVCRNGFLRHPDTYECIPEKLCPRQMNHAQCSKNEIYLICTSKFTECERNCEVKNENLKKCPCKSGCTCKEGFIRSSVTFQCIPEKDCDKCPSGYKFDKNLKKCRIYCSNNENICPKNQTFIQCGSKCRELKCPLSRNESSSVCTQECIAGCYCDAQNGYRRDLITGKCIFSKDCPQCGENEQLTCGNPLCERTCASIDEQCTKYPLRCEYKCYCEENYIRAFEGSQCVSINQCPIINRKDTTGNDKGFQ